MAAIRLTEGRIKALRPRNSARDIRDAKLKGFGIRIYPSGRTCYFIHTQHDGQRIWKVVGNTAETSLAEARQRAQTMLAAIRNGTPLFVRRDPVRNCRRGGLSPVRTHMEAGHTLRQPALLQQSTPAVVQGTPHRGDHAR